MYGHSFVKASMSLVTVHYLVGSIIGSTCVSSAVRLPSIKLGSPTTLFLFFDNILYTLYNFFDISVMTCERTLSDDDDDEDVVQIADHFLRIY